MKTLYHKNHQDTSENESKLEIFNSYQGIVRATTNSGCIVELQFENTKSALCYLYASFNVGDKLVVGITKVFEKEDKYPRGICEQALEYSRDVA